MASKRFFSWLVVVSAALALAGFGCKGVSKEQQQLIKPVKLEYWTVFDDVDALQASIAKFRADRPHITVNVRQLRADELYDRLVEALAEDKGPDIISVNNRSLGTFLSKLGTLPPSVRDTTIRIEKGQFNTETIITPSTKPTVTLDQLDREYLATVKADVVRAGKIYGLPLSVDTMAIYYNKDLLDRAGIAEPPKTWEEFQEAVRKITKYDKTSGKIIQSGAALGAGVNIPWSEDLLYVLFKQSGLSFVDRNGRAVFNSRPNTNANNVETPAMGIMNFYTDFANPTRDTYTWNESLNNALDSFVNGQVAFFFGYQFHNPIIKSRAPQLNYAIMPLLQLAPDAPVNTANYSIQTVTAKSKNPNDAWNLVTYLTHSPATKDYLDRSGRPTALRAYINAQKENLQLAPFVGNLLTASNWYRGNNYKAASTAIYDMLRDWLVPAPDPEREFEYRQNILNRAASRVNQTY